MLLPSSGSTKDVFTEETCSSLLIRLRVVLTVELGGLGGLDEDVHLVVDSLGHPLQSLLRHKTTHASLGPWVSTLRRRKLGVEHGGELTRCRVWVFDHAVDQELLLCLGVSPWGVPEKSASGAAAELIISLAAVEVPFCSVRQQVATCDSPRAHDRESFCSALVFIGVVVAGLQHLVVTFFDAVTSEDGGRGIGWGFALALAG